MTSNVQLVLHTEDWFLTLLAVFSVSLMPYLARGKFQNIAIVIMTSNCKFPQKSTRSTKKTINIMFAIVKKIFQTAFDSKLRSISFWLFLNLQRLTNFMNINSSLTLCIYSIYNNRLSIFDYGLYSSFLFKKVICCLIKNSQWNYMHILFGFDCHLNFEEFNFSMSHFS